MKETDLSIVILSYNTQFWLKKTLSSLQDFYLSKTKYKVDVIVVDNHSQDETLPMLRDDFQWVRVIEAQSNKGFAAGNNLALEEVTSRHVMLLNSDMECSDESNFDILIETLDHHSEFGIITPRIELTTHDVDLACHRGEPTPWASLTYFMGLEKLFPQSKKLSEYHQLYKGLETSHEIDACSGAALMMRTATMHKVGLLDERFFMYAEDLDWCKRTREAWYKVWYEPKVKVIHHKYKSGISSLSRQTATKTKAMFYDTMLQYYDKHYQNRYPTWVRRLIKVFVELKKGAV